MAVITFASSKGGAGKTTSAILLATTLARRYNVVLIDADPAGRMMSWAGKASLPKRLQVFASGGERQIHDEIREAAQEAHFVVLDLEGAATRLNSYAMGESDLVIIPMGDEQMDAEGAIETVAECEMESKARRREIPVRILFARTQAAVKSRLERSLNQQVRTKIGSFETELHRRTAFSSLHNLGGTLRDMDPDEVGGLSRAIANAENFAEEVEKTVSWLARMQEERRIAQMKPMPIDPAKSVFGGI